MVTVSTRSAIAGRYVTASYEGPALASLKLPDPSLFLDHESHPNSAVSRTVSIPRDTAWIPGIRTGTSPASELALVTRRIPSDPPVDSYGSEG